MSKENKIINEQNYSKYIHYLESNLIALSVIKIFKYRVLSSIRCFLYIEQKGNLSIIEDGNIYVKRSKNEHDYLLTKLGNSDFYSLFIKNRSDKAKVDLHNWCIIKHKLFKNFYLVYPYLENDKKTLNFVAKEGKANLIVILIVSILLVIGFLSLFNII